MYIVRLYRLKRECMYLADFRGDPGRTYNRESARKYKTRKGAKSALTQARNRYKREFKGAEIFKY